MKRQTSWMLAVVVGSQALTWGVGWATEHVRTAAPAGMLPALSRPEDAPRLTVAALAKHLAGTARPIVIDLRTTADYQVGHIPGAINVPFELLGTWAGTQTTVAKGLPLVLYCACEAEHSSAVGVILLRNQGFRDVVALLGSWNAWELARQPIRRGPKG
jgi:rhodanese-related sulfurtransferase